MCTNYPLPSGYLYITGRIKELLITRGGENIAPVPIEERMLDQMKLLSNCMVVGDNQKFLTMLVTLRTEVSSFFDVGHAHMGVAFTGNARRGVVCSLLRGVVWPLLGMLRGCG